MSVVDDARAKDERLLIDALDRLPKTADGIASYLRERRVQAVCSHPSRCALAIYLISELPADVTDINVWDRSVNVSIDDRKHAIAPLPNAAKWFVESFDRGHYPSLISPPTPETEHPDV